MFDDHIPQLDTELADFPSARPRAIQHPAPIEYIGQFDTQSNTH